MTQLTKSRKLVKRPFAESYILISLTAFAMTVVITRVFLQLAGYPQVGNSVLHIAHAIWGGLLLFVAVLVALVWANRWALTATAVLSGIGVGLFIDEVGKFITQKNDYFFPPAAPLIYSLFLLVVLLFLVVRRSRQASPRTSMYRVLLGMQELLDNNLDSHERERLLAELENGRSAPEPHIKQLAEQLTTYLQQDSLPLIPYKPSWWEREKENIKIVGEKAGQKNHRRIIIIFTALSSLSAFVTVLVLLGLWLLQPETGVAALEFVFEEAKTLSTQNPVWLLIRLTLQALVGLLYGLTLLLLWRRQEIAAMDIGIFAALLSVTAVNLLTFYLDQFTALTSIFANFILLFLFVTYRAWYLETKTFQNN